MWIDQNVVSLHLVFPKVRVYNVGREIKLFEHFYVKPFYYENMRLMKG